MHTVNTLGLNNNEHYVQMIHTGCSRSSDPFYIVTYVIKWVTTSWTDGKLSQRKGERRKKKLHNKLGKLISMGYKLKKSCKRNFGLSHNGFFSITVTKRAIYYRKYILQITQIYNTDIRNYSKDLR